MTVSLSSASSGSASLSGNTVMFNVKEFCRVNVYITSAITYPITGTYIPQNSSSSSSSDAYPSTFSSGIAGTGTVKTAGDSYYNQSSNGWFYSVLCTTAVSGTSSFCISTKSSPQILPSFLLVIQRLLVLIL